MAEKAVEWLKTAQHDGGYWQEEAMPDGFYLTVLVLDALALAGGSTVTSLPSEVTRSGGQPSKKRFRVALSFPGEARSLVDPIAGYLASTLGKGRVLYDQFLEAELARPNLDTYLQRLYHAESELVVVFIGSDYAKKDWCSLEWRAIRNLIKSRQDDAIMLFRLDEGDVPGIFPLDGYISTEGREPEELSLLITKRLIS